MRRVQHHVAPLVLCPAGEGSPAMQCADDRIASQGMPAACEVVHRDVQKRMGSEGKLGGVLLRCLGLRKEGLAAAAALPVLLTALLFLGPLAMLAWDALHGSSAGRPRRRLSEAGALASWVR
jgi:hypothetical protein